MENSDAYDTQPELIGYFGTSHMCKKILMGCPMLAYEAVVGHPMCVKRY